MMDPFSDMSDNEFFNNMSHSTLSKSVNNLNNTFFKFNIENLESQPVTALICSLITWSTLYFITVALLDRSPEFCTRVVTLIHGLLTTGMGSYICKMKMENKIEGTKLFFVFLTYTTSVSLLQQILQWRISCPFAEVL